MAFEEQFMPGDDSQKPFALNARGLELVYDGEKLKDTTVPTVGQQENTSTFVGMANRFETELARY